MLVGYARVSTNDQDLRLQLDALQAAGCDKIFTDKASGTNGDRTGLAEALWYTRTGDTLVVWKLDRLGRSMKGLIDLAETLKSREVDLQSLTDGIDTKTPAGRFFFHVMAALAVMERELMLERTKAGLESARQAGRVGGRPRALTEDRLIAAKTLLNGGMTRSDIAKTLNISIATVYRYLPASMPNQS